MTISVDEWLGRLWRTIAAPAKCRFCASSLSPEFSNIGACQLCIADLPWNSPCCSRCAEPLNVANALCARCQKKPPQFDQIVAPLKLITPVNQLVYGMKYHAQFSSVQFLAHILAGEIQARRQEKPDLLIPVPLYKRRLRKRGYNQSLLLAKKLSDALHIPLEADAVIRVKESKDLIGQTAAQRRKQLKGVFQARREFTGQNICVVDDVVTSTATANEMAKICKKAGATTVTVWACARTPWLTS